MENQGVRAVEVGSRKSSHPVCGGQENSEKGCSFTEHQMLSQHCAHDILHILWVELFSLLRRG